nr:hypothetical protein [Candidatus Contendobacter sp.]
VYMVGYTNSPNAGFTFGPITPYRSYSGGKTDPGDGKGGADAFAAKFSIPVVNTEFSLAVQLQGSGSGAVTSVPQGIGQTAACQLENGVLVANADCDASYPTGTSVTLTAAPSVGAVLVGWSGSGSGTCAGTSTLTCVVIMNAAKTVVANFALAKNLTVSKEGTGSGTVTSSPAGIAITCDPTCSSATFPFPTSTVVTLTAAVKTESGSTFAGWSGADDCNGSTSTTCQVTIGPADKNVTATFTGVATNLLAVFTAGLGTGTVTSTPTGINCGGSCTEASPATFNFPATTPITLTATPNIDSVFVKWTGACTGSALTCDVTVSTAKTVRAEFSLPYQVNVTVGGSGSVTSEPEGISCTTNPATDPKKCSSGFANGNWVKLTATAIATPSSDYVFTDWQGTCGLVDNTSPTCRILVFGIENITARFSPSVKLTVQTAGNGTGTVASTLPDNEINCISGTTTGGCTKDYPLGIKVTLTATATADTGSTFAGWSGDDCVGVAPTCVVTMNNAKTVKATFNPKSYLLTVRTGAGTVTSSPAGISCGTACTASYVQGTTVTLTAVPDAGFMFAGWSGGACSGLNLSCMVTMTAAMNVTATFSISTLPDLIVPALRTPAVGIPNIGRTVSFALQVKNQGNAAAGAFRVGLYLSKDQIITPKDINTGNQCQFSSLAAGVTVPCSSTFNLPQGLVSGVYYLGAYADPYNAIQESNKTNNSRASDNTLTAYTLGITKTGTGSGTVTSVPSGITCGVGANCTAAFLAGATATLIAAPAANSALVSWTGCTPTLGKPTQCTVLMNATKAVTANFGPGFKLTVVKIGTGTVNSAAVGINCGTICTAQVLKNRIVSLTAAPATGWQFAGWIGCTAASGATCSVTMSTAKTVTATFKPKLTVIKTGSGTVTSVPAGINCGATCIAPFNLNSVVTLTAKPITGQQLKRWVGCTTTTGATCTVNMTAAKTVQANFGL